MEAGKLTISFRGSKNMPLLPDLFLRDSHFGDSGLEDRSQARPGDRHQPRRRDQRTNGYQAVRQDYSHDTKSIRAPAAARGRVLRCPRLPPEFTTSAPSVRTSPATIALILYQSWIQIYRLCVPSNALRTSTDYTDRRSLVPREKPLKKRVLKPFLFPVRYHG